ncbi:DUF2141 domain-containing protein [Thermodesulfobacteriota bacterium]
MRNRGRTLGFTWSTQAKRVGVGIKIMNESINPKSAEAFTVKDPQKGFLMRVRCVLLFAVLVFGNLPAMASAQSSPCPGIHVKVLNIRNSTGTVSCALFDSPIGFPIEYLRYATNLMAIKIRDAQARFDFLDIPPGTYSLAVIHDENMDGKLDTDWLGAPKEGYGFSNDAKAFLSAPSFSAATFQYDGGNLDLTIPLHY